MPPLVKKIVQLLLTTMIIGVSVWFQPQDILPSFHAVEVNEIYKKVNLYEKENITMDVVVNDVKGNPFSMRSLSSKEYPAFLQRSTQVEKVLSCRQYTYAGQTWYEWCTEEGKDWVMYRWENGETTLRRII